MYLFHRVSRRNNFTTFLKLNILYESKYLTSSDLKCYICEKSISDGNGAFHVFNCQGENLSLDVIAKKLKEFNLDIDPLKKLMYNSQKGQKNLSQNEFNSLHSDSVSNRIYYFLEYEFYWIN